MIILLGISTAIALHYYLVCRKLMICPVFGCLTRQGLERRKPKPGAIVVFLDIDDMKGANSTYGYAEVNRRIAASVKCLRSHELTIGRWFFGDEFVFWLSVGTDCGAELCDRVTEAFKRNGLGVTMAWGIKDSSSLEDQVDSLSKRVLAAKSAR